LMWTFGRICEGALAHCEGRVFPLAAIGGQCYPRASLPASIAARLAPVSGRSSGVEHNLAKVGVEGSNPFARSSFLYRDGNKARGAQSSSQSSVAVAALSAALPAARPARPPINPPSAPPRPPNPP